MEALLWTVLPHQPRRLPVLQVGRLLFIWATPYACFYFGPKGAAAHTLWTAAVFAVSLWLMPAQTHVMAPRVYLITMGTVAAVAGLVTWAAHKLRTAVDAQRHLALHDPLTGLPNRSMLAISAAWADPILLGSMATHTAASIGIAVATSPDDSAESLLRDADAAMYVAKRTNPGGPVR